MQALSLIHLRRYEEAKLCGDTIEKLLLHKIPSTGVGSIVSGTAALHQALRLTEKDRVVDTRLLGEARRYLATALHHGQDHAASRILLAVLEYYGSMRKKQERIEDHLSRALRMAKRPVRAKTLLLAGKLTGSTSYQAKAVHMTPWQRDAWKCLKGIQSC